MFMHQALPKDINPPKRAAYEIKKRISPRHKPNTLKQDQSQPSMLQHSIQKTHMHHITSKEKPNLSSVQKYTNKLTTLPKPINVNSLKKVEEPKPFDSQINLDSSRKKQIKLLSPQLEQTVFCRIQNKVVKAVHCPFLYTDLSQIEQVYCQVYEGQSKNNGIRHGYGTQRYSNGQKFMGFFNENKANGQGTYYSLRKTIMGVWKNDRLKQIIVQI